MMSISDIFRRFETFRNEVCFPRLTLAGGESQINTTRPMPDEDSELIWTEMSVQPTSAGSVSAAEMGAAYVFGFKLYKDDGPGATL
jgi:hypothetical protein